MSNTASPNYKLPASLKASVDHALSLSTRRPLLTHLNADTTWLLSLPIPSPSPSSRRNSYFHILIDPWLRGGQSDVAAFFSRQWHNEASAFQTIPEVEEAIRGIEEAVRDHHEGNAAGGFETSPREQPSESSIDAVVVSHEFTDHMHRETLLEIPRRVPVFATAKAAGIIRSWRHFDAVVDVPPFSGDWRESSTTPLPAWLGVSRVAYPGSDLLYYHSAIMVTFAGSSSSSPPPSSSRPETAAEAVIYTPHGISSTNLAPVATATPTLHTLALLHGLHDITIWTRAAQLNLGAHNGLQVQRLLKARYWISTHDEVKKGGGIVSWFLNRKVLTLGEAVEKERQERAKLGTLEGSEVEGLGEVRFEELGNGCCLLLE